MSARRYSPLFQLTVARFREFYREPAAIFWVYGFPLLMAVALGIAFRERPVEKSRIEVREAPEIAAEEPAYRQRLRDDPRLAVNFSTEPGWQRRLSRGKADLVVEVTRGSGGLEFAAWDEPNRAESVLARQAFENALARDTAGRPDVTDHHLEEAGSRYIDFLIPGLLGMNLMGGGLFGVGFVIVDMRVRKLLKRFLATPMRRSDFMLAVMLSRLVFLLPEVLLILAFGYFAFGVTVQGSFLALLFVILLGAMCFAGLGLLVACRAKTIETASGLMNLLMLPMYILSGVFFSAERFPDAMQPFIKALPLTALNDALRAVMLEAKPLTAIWSELLIIVAWGCLSFAVALRYFRWK
jgi:ABC-2 type transport system permease protein